MKERPHWKELLAGRHVSPNQAFTVRWLSQPMGSVVAALACRLGIGPNTVTLAGLCIMLLACLPYALAETPTAWIAAAILWQLGFAFDCADGQLARATGVAGPYGAWLDAACDHIRQSTTALAVLAVFINAHLPTVLGFAATLLLLCGLSVFLHTATFMNAEQPAALATTGIVSTLRRTLRFVLDTPMFLLFLCLLRPWPLLLLVYCALYGLLLIVRAGSLGRLRLRG